MPRRRRSKGECTAASERARILTEFQHAKRALGIRRYTGPVKDRMSAANYAKAMATAELRKDGQLQDLYEMRTRPPIGWRATLLILAAAVAIAWWVST